MTFSFNAALTTDLDKVRILLGDTVESPRALENETISAYLVTFASVNRAALECARVCRAQMVGDTDRSGMSFSDQRSQKFEHWTAIIKQLEAMTSSAATPFFGGISLAVNETLDADTDGRAPAHRLGQDDYP